MRQKLGNGPGVGKCPVPAQFKICKCPTPGTDKASKCPTVAPRGGGGGAVTRFCYALVRTLFCVFCPTNTGFVQCSPFGFRSLLHAFVVIVIYVSCSLPHQHRACAALFPSAPLRLTLFCFFLFY